MDYEYIAKGFCYSFSNIKVLVYNIQKTEKVINF